MLRDHGGGSAFAAARVRGALAAAHGDGGGKPVATVDAGQSKVHAAVDSLGNLLAACHSRQRAGSRPGGKACQRYLNFSLDDDRKLAEEVQRITGDPVELGYVDPGYTGEAAESAAARHGIQLGGGQTHGGKAWFRPADAPLSGREMSITARITAGKLSMRVSGAPEPINIAVPTKVTATSASTFCNASVASSTVTCSIQ
jgi:hypothetical protein